jgi:hypothetical protein
MANIEPLFKAFQAFCCEGRNYSKGWDIPAECWDLEEFRQRLERQNLSLEVLAQLRLEDSLRLVVRTFRSHVELLAEVRTSVQNEIF